MTFPVLPEEGSLGAREVDNILVALVAMAFFFSTVIAGAIVWFSFKYRRNNPVNRVRSDAHSLKLEIAWTVLPLLIGIGFFTVAAATYFRERHPPAAAMEIHVIGKRWMWKIQHPQGKREINEVHLPIGVPVRLLMTSQDVIHSFYIPAFRIKQDVLPGRYTTLWMVPSKIGSYHLFCSQYCGTDHARMIGQVTVMSRPDYQTWLTTGEHAESPVVRGAQLFRQFGCSGCHAGSEVIRAPSLVGVYGSTVPLDGGGTVLADEQYLRDSILLPNAQIVAGYAPVMPSFAGHISEDDLMALIAYLKSIGAGQNGESGRQSLTYPERAANPAKASP